MKILWAAVFLFLYSANPAGAADTDLNSLFFKANRLYFNNDFQPALDIYLSILKQYKTSLPFYSRACGELFYNAGNCYFRLQEKGKAMLNYKRALMIMPRDADLKYNLEYLQDTLKDKLPPAKAMIGDIIGDIFGVNFFSPTEIAILFCTFNLLLFLFITVRIFLKSEWTFYVINIFLLFWIVAGISSGIMLKQTVFDDRVVILEKEVDVLAGPDKHDTLLFKVHEGTVAQQERIESGFSLIRLRDGKRGWLLLSSIEAVMPITKNKNSDN